MKKEHSPFLYKHKFEFNLINLTSIDNFAKIICL